MFSVVSQFSQWDTSQPTAESYRSENGYVLNRTFKRLDVGGGVYPVR